MNRRDFLAAMGGGLVVLVVDDVWLVDHADAQESGGGARRGFSQRLPEELNAWLHIGQDGAITGFTGKVEIGQNARTSLTQAIAEELHAPIGSIRLIMGDTALTPFDLGTFGSRTTPTMWPQLRKAAAAAREMLLDLAAQKWGVARSTLTVADGKVKSPGRETGFGELTRGQNLSRAIPAAVLLEPATEWKVAGASIPKVDGRAMVTGSHRYPYDFKLPGMLYGKVCYPPVFHAKLTALDATKAEAIPGVIVLRDGDFVGVAAPDEPTAERALQALRPEWGPPEKQPPSSGPDLGPYLERHSQGTPPTAIDQTYEIAYIAHVPLEPRAAVAQWSEGKLTVWTGTQRPFGVRSELAAHFQIPEDHVHVFMPDMGSGYGGKHTGDPALEAARLAQPAGKPVMRRWTREEEMTWAYFRPAGVIKVAAKVAPDGTLTSWEFHNYNSGPAALATPYHVLSKREEFHESDSPLRQGSYRGLAATANHFARESYMDELAHAARLDPLEFRLKNAADERLRAVMQAAAGRFGWKARRKAPGRGFGMAAGFEKGGYVATCAEIQADAAGGAVKVLRVVEAFECGAVVNPEHLRNQIEGAIAQGLGGALFEKVEFAGGKILNDRLSRYRVPRFEDMPAIETIVIDRKDLPSAGAGETPIVGIAPALANAIFDATGKRIRSMPLT